jgi:hypothetical protein
MRVAAYRVSCYPVGERRQASVRLAASVRREGARSLTRGPGAGHARSELAARPLAAEPARRPELGRLRERGMLARRRELARLAGLSELPGRAELARRRELSGLAGLSELGGCVRSGLGRACGAPGEVAGRRCLSGLNSRVIRGCRVGGRWVSGRWVSGRGVS